MKQMITSSESKKTHHYIEIINHGNFTSYFSISYNYNNQIFKLKSKILNKGMLDKILVPETATYIDVIVYLKLQNGQLFTLYSKNFTTSQMIKLLLEGTESSPTYHDVTTHPSVDEANHLPSHHVSVSNKGFFIALFKVEYTLNNKKYYLNSSYLSQNYHEKVFIPTLAKDIIISVMIKDKNNPWKAIYTETFNMTESLSLSLSGTFNNPQYKEITSQLESEKTPTLAQESIYVSNNGDFVTKFMIDYTMLETQYTITTPSFAKGNFKSLNIPENSTDIEFIIYLLNSDDSWFIVYQDFFNTPTSLKLELSGILSAPIVTDIKNDIPEVEGPVPVIPPKITLTKVPNNPMCLLGSEIIFTLTISNKEGIDAKNVFLKDILPPESTFVLNSLTLDGSIINGDIFSKNGLSLGNILSGKSHKITYKLIFKLLPNPNPIKYYSVITYNYEESDTTIKSVSLTGTTLPLMIINHHCCCCPCMNQCINPNKPI